MMHYEADKYRVLSKIDKIFSTIFERLLPVYNNIEDEAKQIEKDKLESLSKSFNPETMDPSDAYQEAWEDGAEHYSIQHEMKQEFLLNNATWLFHLFEKDCLLMFDGKKGIDAINYLNGLGIETDSNSKWHTINKELRLLANAIKHGEGPSFTALEVLRPDFFDSTYSTVQVKINAQDLEHYIDSMKNFWNVFFDKVLPTY